ncbi:MAG TPA: hypothetical protein VK753_00110 [Xanthomonadaceae bacterium]|jgi:hypothetical protein|nr:hypothetical protein [Xanthomonadaceae bacterium]
MKIRSALLAFALSALAGSAFAQSNAPAQPATPAAPAAPAAAPATPMASPEAGTPMSTHRHTAVRHRVRHATCTRHRNGKCVRWSHSHRHPIRHAAHKVGHAIHHAAHKVGHAIHHAAQKVKGSDNDTSASPASPASGK